MTQILFSFILIRSSKKVWIKKVDFKKYIISNKLEAFKMLESKLVYNHDESQFLRGLTRCRKEAISDSVNAIILPHPIPALVKSGDKHPHIIYERTSRDLLSSITSKSLIVGTSYTGKSSLIYYFLARHLNSDKVIFRSLPPTCPGSDRRLKVVIYRVGSDFTLYFLDELKAYTYVNVVNDYRLINCFDSSRVLCFYDDEESLSSVNRTSEIMSVLTHSHYSVIITAVPNEVNVVNIINARKHDRSFRFLSHQLWSLPDLSSLYTYHKTGLPYDVSKGQNYDRIPIDVVFSRNIYGGTLRSIQCSTPGDLTSISQRIKNAIDSIDFTRFWEVSNNYYNRLEPFIHNYIFHLGTNRVESPGNSTLFFPRIRPASSLVSNFIYETYLSRYTQEDLVQSMKIMTENSHVWSLTNFSMLLQLYLSRQISTVGCTDGWTVRANHHPDSDLRPFNLHMPVERGNMPAFTNMLNNVLYIPDISFRIFLVYKCRNSETGASELNMIKAGLASHPSAVIGTEETMKILRILGLDTSTSGVKCNYYVCPLKDAHSCVVSTYDNEPMPSFLGSASIIHLPPLFEPVSASTAGKVTASTISPPCTGPIADSASSDNPGVLPQSSTSQQ